MPLCQSLHCPFEEDKLICRGEAILVVPVDLELTIGIFMICLIDAESAGIQRLHLHLSL